MAPVAASMGACVDCDSWLPAAAAGTLGVLLVAHLYATGVSVWLAAIVRLSSIKWG